VGVASLPVTLPRKPRDLADDLIDLRAAAARIGKEYGAAFDYAYGLRRSGNGQVTVKTPTSDPTSTAYAAGGNSRGLLRRCSGKVQAALRALEDAEALGDMYEQGWATTRAVQAGYLALARKVIR
jgi:hypothetical protein